MTLSKTIKCLLGSPYQLINAEITNSCNYLQMYENVSKTEAHERLIQSKVVVPKKMFSL